MRYFNHLTIKLIATSFFLLIAVSCGNLHLAEAPHHDPFIEETHVLAYNYDLGINGFPQDRKKANSLYLKTAYNCHIRSMLNYSVNLFNGIGIDQNKPEAYAWIKIAKKIALRSPDIKAKWGIIGYHDRILNSLDNINQKKAGSLRAREIAKKISNC